MMSATVGEVHRLNTAILAKVKGLFYRQYRAALLDYLLGSGEAGRARAYELGRWAVDSNLGLLHVLLVHQQAVNAILEATGKSGDGLRQLKASQEFLMETLSPLEMACRGYVELISHTSHDNRHQRGGG